jgi:hypothetical protein
MSVPAQTIPKTTETPKKVDLIRACLYGGGGVGKTVATVSCLKHPNINRLIYLQTEPNSAAGIKEGLRIHKIVPKEGQIITCFPARKENPFINFSRAFEAYQGESKSSALKGDPNATQNKDKYGYFLDIVGQFSKFTGVDYVTGKTVTLGNIGQFKPSDVFIIDGLSVIMAEIWQALNGDKILTAMSDYGPVQQNALKILQNLAGYCSSHYIILAHEKEKREHGRDEKGKEFSTFLRNEVNVLCGEANYELLMGTFTDVIRATKAGQKFIWEVGHPKSYSINRNLPIGNMLEPDFSKHNFFN